MTNIIDISLPIHPNMPIYPGDQETVFETTIKPSGSQLTKITIGSHAGTHIDAPSHAGLVGSIDDYSLEAFYGECRVIEVLDVDVITVADVAALDISAGERILFKTDNSARGYEVFHDSWTALSSEAASYLASCGVALIGIDWFGVKQKGAPDNGAHTELLSKGIPILEGIDLSEVAGGIYVLSALPMSYQGIDGAGVRAVLIRG